MFADFAFAALKLAASLELHSGGLRYSGFLIRRYQGRLAVPDGAVAVTTLEQWSIGVLENEAKVRANAAIARSGLPSVRNAG